MNGKNGGLAMTRNTAALRAGRFDLLVVGGGVYGAWTAYDAALRGLSVALVERNDWGSGTSSASSKLIHGGLRYLEHFEFRLVRHALRERRRLTRIAPHLVRPLRFIVPLWKDSRFGRLQLGAGLMLYDSLAGRHQPVPRRRRYSLARLRREQPALRAEGLLGAWAYGDCQEDDARLTLAAVAAAHAAGATVANRVEALELLPQGDRVRVALRDLETQEAFAIEAGCVVDACGPWAAALLGPAAPPMRLIKGVHLVMPGIPQGDTPEAFLLTAPQDGRVFFVIPWYGRTLVGTTESQVDDANGARVTAEDRRYLLDAVRHALPGLNWGEEQILGAFAGVRSLQAENEQDLSAVTREFVIRRPLPRVIAPLGGKYTTARHDAGEIVDAVERTLGRRARGAQTGGRPLPGAPPEPFEDWSEAVLPRLIAAGLDAQSAEQVCLRQGLGVERVLELVAADPRLAARLHPELGFVRAELVIGVRDEMARSAVDLLRRRVPLMLLARPHPPAIEAAAGVLAEAFGWDAARREQEVQDCAAAWARCLAA